MTSAPILLTCATGYVGGRLLRVLEERGQRVRCLTRRPEAVAPHRDTTTIVAGDVLEPESLRPRPLVDLQRHADQDRGRCAGA